MEGKVKNLCAPIPAGLHARVREAQEASGQTLGQYMTWLIQTFYDNQNKEENTMNTDKRTVAFQVPGELFEKFKDYLQEKGIKQNAFFLDCIHRALAEAQEEREAASNEGDGENPPEKGPTPPTRGTGRIPRRRAPPRRAPKRGLTARQMLTARMRMQARTAQRNKPREGDPARQAGSLPTLEVFSCSSTRTT